MKRKVDVRKKCTREAKSMEVTITDGDLIKNGIPYYKVLKK